MLRLKVHCACFPLLRKCTDNHLIVEQYVIAITMKIKRSIDLLMYRLLPLRYYDGEKNRKDVALEGEKSHGYKTNNVEGAGDAIRDKKKVSIIPTCNLTH